MLRDIVVFLAGAETFHTLVHMGLPYFVNFPVDVGTVTLTPMLSFWAILVNGAIAIGLIVLASRMKRS